MERITRIYCRLSNRAADRRGQTMAEYALIMATIAVIAFAAYQLLGSNVSSITSTIAGSV